MHPYQEMGMMSAQILKQRIETNKNDELGQRVIRFGGEIIVRESTAVAPS